MNRSVTLAVLVLTAPIALAGTALADEVEVLDGRACVNPSGDAECRVVAASVHGDADGDLVAVTATGNSTGFVPVSATDGCRNGDEKDYRECFAVEEDEDARGFWIGASEEGDTEGWIAVSVDGEADGFVVGASGTGTAAGIGAASVEGDADGLLVGASGTNNATGLAMAASGTGGADGTALAVSGTNDARADALAVSGKGKAVCFGFENDFPCVAVSVLGEASCRSDRCITVSR